MAAKFDNRKNILMINLIIVRETILFYCPTAKPLF